MARTENRVDLDVSLMIIHQPARKSETWSLLFLSLNWTCADDDMLSSDWPVFCFPTSSGEGLCSSFVFKAATTASIASTELCHRIQFPQSLGLVLFLKISTYGIRAFENFKFTLWGQLNNRALSWHHCRRTGALELIAAIWVCHLAPSPTVAHYLPGCLTHLGLGFCTCKRSIIPFPALCTAKSGSERLLE